MKLFFLIFSNHLQFFVQLSSRLSLSMLLHINFSLLILFATALTPTISQYQPYVTYLNVYKHCQKYIITTKV